MDLITGIIGGFKGSKKLDSSKLRDGLFKKVGFLLCYSLAFMVDNYGHIVGFTFTLNITPAIVLYSCLTELVSIIENICKINPDFLPENLKKIFKIGD